jgi:hypothetical protein
MMKYRLSRHAEDEFIIRSLPRAVLTGYRINKIARYRRSDESQL